MSRPQCMLFKASPKSHPGTILRCRALASRSASIRCRVATSLPPSPDHLSSCHSEEISLPSHFGQVEHSHSRTRCGRRRRGQQRPKHTNLSSYPCCRMYLALTGRLLQVLFLLVGSSFVYEPDLSIFPFQVECRAGHESSPRTIVVLILH